MADRSTETMELVELSRADCLARLEAGSFGRVAINGERFPMLRPVNYRFDVPSQSVVFRSAPGSKLGAVRRARQAVFEIDEIDPTSSSGWSVIILGVTEEITNASELWSLGREEVPCWAPGEQSHWVRIRAFTVSGRSIRPRRDPGADGASVG